MPEHIQIIARRFGIKSEQYVAAMRDDQREAGRRMSGMHGMMPNERRPQKKH